LGPKPHPVPEPRQHPDEVPVLDAEGVRDAVERIAAGILESGPEDDGVGLAFVGIERRGVPLADRVRAACAGSGRDIVTGSLDISLYRDDFDNLGTVPTLRASRIGFDPTGRRVVLFDDVLFTGRTVRAAIDALMDFGRPSRIRLAVLVDRGNRDLPIQADHVGFRLPTSREDHVWVRFRETDGRDGVSVLRGAARGGSGSESP
jgi:pyrimidine operon attenuation protein/uracil phosphoribosyltransferase